MSLNHSETTPSDPWFMEKLFSVKLIPGDKKVGDRCSKWSMRLWLFCVWSGQIISQRWWAFVSQDLGPVSFWYWALCSSARPPKPQLHPDWPLLVLGWSWDTQRRYLCPGAWAFGGCAGGQATSCAPTQSGSHQCYPSAVVCILKMHLFCFGATEYRKASVTGGQPSQFARSHTGLVLWCWKPQFQAEPWVPGAGVVGNPVSQFRQTHTATKSCPLAPSIRLLNLSAITEDPGGPNRKIEACG